MVALHWMARRNTIVVEGGMVRVASRSLIGGDAWREPLASYCGIRARRIERRHRYCPLRWHVIELWHPDPAKTVELARTRDPCAGAKQAETWAGRLTQPLCWEPHEHLARSGHEARDKVGGGGSRSGAARGSSSPVGPREARWRASRLHGGHDPRARIGFAADAAGARQAIPRAMACGLRDHVHHGGQRGLWAIIICGELADRLAAFFFQRWRWDS
jgi:hypothetical protein